jgi:hypothetical protein
MSMLQQAAHDQRPQQLTLNHAGVDDDDVCTARSSSATERRSRRERAGSARKHALRAVAARVQARQSEPCVRMRP